MPPGRIAVIEELYGPPDPYARLSRPTVAEVIDAAALACMVDRLELVGPRRDRHIARPRQIAMFLAREMTGQSFPEIARRLGGRDHTTAMHGFRTIERLHVVDGAIAESVIFTRRIANALAAERVLELRTRYGYR